MRTYQDFVKAADKLEFIKRLVTEYIGSDEYRIAAMADQYEKQQNTTIKNYTKYLYTSNGTKVVDFTASNNRIASNLFHRLNTDRCAYSLGNGVFFTHKENRDGVTVDTTKEKLGSKFDTLVYDAAYKALIHRVSYTFWNLDHGVVFPATQFAPLWDEYDGRLRAGVRFWSLDWDNKPVTAVLYEEDGYTKYRSEDGRKGLSSIVEYEPKKAYKLTIRESKASGAEVIGESNYGALPIVPLWGCRNRQSTLVGMQSKIDAYDLIQSGFANDLEDCAEIYWIVGNAMGMDDKDLAQFRDRLKLNHIALADTDNSTVTPYTHEIPTAARETFLKNIRDSLYEDFGVLDVHTVAAGATNDHIDAGYQPMDEEADDFEYQLIEYIQQILALIGIDDVPQFKRNKISNQRDQTEMVMLCADHLDDATLLNKLPFLTVDEVEAVLRNRDAESYSRFDEEADQVVDEE